MIVSRPPKQLIVKNCIGLSCYRSSLFIVVVRCVDRFKKQRTTHGQIGVMGTSTNFKEHFSLTFPRVALFPCFTVSLFLIGPSLSSCEFLACRLHLHAQAARQKLVSRGNLASLSQSIEVLTQQVKAIETFKSLAKENYAGNLAHKGWLVGLKHMHGMVQAVKPL